jgi:hypothetical protein
MVISGIAELGSIASSTRFQTFRRTLTAISLDVTVIVNAVSIYETAWRAFGASR